MSSKWLSRFAHRVGAACTRLSEIYTAVVMRGARHPGLDITIIGMKLEWLPSCPLENERDKGRDKRIGSRADHPTHASRKTVPSSKRGITVLFSLILSAGLMTMARDLLVCGVR
ncbi:hypothetical protein ElyMa_000013800 [Elysia marginata]|uniref:Uncharacterized protein n=1 Tax=Elysia marginata TaxID=1093978 RepID=A0AAV4EBY4_9GAST|nr:hypothetical protein ElyMa_000013800 [Elysia marginata]